MLPSLTQQQLQLYQMLQLQQMQLIQAASAKQPDLQAFYQTWLLNANLQQLNSFVPQPVNLSLPMAMPPVLPKVISTSPSPAASPSDAKRKAVSISDLVDAIHPLKRSCPNSAPLTPVLTTPTPSLITTPPSIASLSSAATVSDNTEVAGPASIKSRSESSSISDTEPDEFIDVVGDPVPKTKAQRKAHIEFYRKIKLLRNREKQLQCALCNETVKNVESSVRAHVTSHADASMLICKICCYSSGDLNEMFGHMVLQHPAHRTCYEDRRNMTQLSELLSSCFPRGGVTKQRTGLQDSIQKVIEIATKKGATMVTCAICTKEVQVSKEGLTRHINLHHVYRCKKCKSTFQLEEEMQAHCQSSHGIEDPRSATDYHITAAVDAVGSVFRRCFEKHMTE